MVTKKSNRPNTHTAELSPSEADNYPPFTEPEAHYIPPLDTS
jgi:hypothetical protein